MWFIPSLLTSSLSSIVLQPPFIKLILTCGLDSPLLPDMFWLLRLETLFSFRPECQRQSPPEWDRPWLPVLYQPRFIFLIALNRYFLEWKAHTSRKLLSPVEHCHSLKKKKKVLMMILRKRSKGNSVALFSMWLWDSCALFCLPAFSGISVCYFCHKKKTKY